MSVEVSSVHTAAALAKGMRSYAPTALGNSCSVSLALLSSMPSTSAAGGGMATAVPACSSRLSDTQSHAHRHALVSGLQSLWGKECRRSNDCHKRLRADQRHACLPEKTGVSSGPVQCRTPRTAPPTGKGRGRMARVFRRSFASTPGTLALSLYWPVSGFKSMSPARQFDAKLAA